MNDLKVRIPEELFAPAESSCFSGQWEKQNIRFGSDEYQFITPLRWNVSISNVGDALLVAGLVHGVAEISCARCLDTFTLPLDGTIEGYYLLKQGAEEELDLDDDEFEILAADKVIDLEPLIEAAILLEIPLMPLCSEDCKGLCYVCGQNQNENDCSCAKDEDSVRDNPFSVLKNISLGD